MYTYPHTIVNGGGEEITFTRKREGDTEYLEVHNRVAPGAGPPMHTHFQQEEGFTVMQGKLGVLIEGRQPSFHGEGETVVFPAGQPHKFWNAGTEPLICKGWIVPADNLEYFLTEIYKSTEANGGKRPGNFDAAYLLQKYASEFAMNEIPVFVRKVIFPFVVFMGKLQGKHSKFADGPPPLR